MDRRAEILAGKLEAAKAAGHYEKQTRVLFVECEEEDEVTMKIVKVRKMLIFTPVFLFAVSYRRGEFRVNRLGTNCPLALTPTYYMSVERAAQDLKEKWFLHGQMDAVEFLSWLKTALGGRAYQAYAELIS